MRPRWSGGSPRDAQRDRLAGLRAGGDLDRDLAVQARHLHGRAERRQRRRDVDHRVQVLLVAHEALVLAHPDDDVEVAVRPAALAGVAAPAQPDPLAVGDAGRDVDVQRARLGRLAGAVARPQGCSGTRPSPPQTSHTAVRTSWPKRVRETAWSWPEPWQRAHVTIGVPGSAPLPWQRSQRTSTS